MTDQTSGGGTRAPDPAISPSRRLRGETIGKVLRAQYDSVLAEPVPAEMLALLDALVQREAET